MSTHRSKLILLFSIMAVLTGLSPQVAGICGDINNDGNGPDISDLTYMVAYMFKAGTPPPQMFSTDINGDGSPSPDIADLTYLVAYMFKGGPAPTCPISTPNTTTVIPLDSSNVVLGYDTAGGVVTLDGGSYYAQQVAIGDIIIGHDDVDAPNGFLRKATSITTQGNSIVVETVPATMMEAFEEMDIDETHSLNPVDVKSMRLLNGTTFKPNRDGQTFDVSLNCVLYDLDGDPGTTNDQVRLVGTYAFTADLFAKIKMKRFSLQRFEVGIETNEQIDLDLIAQFQWQFTQAVEIDLAEFHLGAIPVGGVVWLVPTLTVEAHIHGDLTVTFETAISYIQELRYGFGWADNAYYTISEGTKNSTYTPPQFSAEFNFEPGTSLNASCLLYGVAGPYVAAKAGFHFQAALSADPCDVELAFDLEAILYAVAGIECDIVNLDYNYQWQLYTHLIGQWNYPLGGSGTIVIDPEPDALNAHWSLAGPCNYTSSGNGDQTLNGLDPGEYAITWESEAGWISPSNAIQTLSADDTITFSGTYLEESELTGTVTDYDGNVYQTIKIGDQWWMIENLKVTHYRNCDPIPNVTDANTWSGLATGAYCDYDNDEVNVDTYGRLYNWYSVDDNRKLAPTGWHVPTDEEWKELEMFLGMSQPEADADGYRGTDEGGKLKDTGITQWSTPNTGATNESGFTGLPGGHRTINGTFRYMGTYASFRSSTEQSSVNAWSRYLQYDNSQVRRYANYKEDGYSVRCVRDSISTPVVTTATIGDTTQFSAQCGGTINSNGGSPVTSRGVCWSTQPFPTIADDTTSDGTGIGGYASTIVGLTPNTNYYVRAYATNSVGTGFGIIHSFTTLPIETGSVTDIDGNVYQTVKIGDQWWMAENLKVTRHQNGDPIPHVTDGSTWGGLTTGAYCEYDNNPANATIYGCLYNWYAVDDSRNIAPAGWHVPTDDELKQLEMYFGMSRAEADGTGLRGTDEGGKLKEAGTAHWISPNTGATNVSGFSALPGGYRYVNGYSNQMGYYAYFWSSTETNSNDAWHRHLNFNNSQVYRNYSDKHVGFSVRCVRD